jgi:hypothetical protein
MAEEIKTPAKTGKNEIKNVRQKLQEARMLLKEEKMNKSGKNTFTKINYFTLDDIEPAIIKVCSMVGITPVVTFTKEVALLTIFDWDSEDKIEFTSPMVEQKDGKMNEIQTLGSLQTYYRRYLYAICFTLSEENEEKQDTLAYHDIMAVKNRIEVLMTDLMKKGYDMNEVITKIGLKDEKQYLGYLNACGVIDKLEKNMRVILNDKK